VPRRSKADLDSPRVVPLAQYTPPEPPADLDPPVAAVWRSTVASMRADWLHAAMFPLMRCYCRSVVLVERFAGELRQRFDGDCKIDAELESLLARHDAETRRMMALARSLRLTPKSRRDPVDRRWEDRRRPSED